MSLGEDGAVGAKRSGIGIRAPQDALAGVFLIAVGVTALVLGADLPMGTLRSMGAGMLPKSLAVMVAGAGVLLLISAFLADGAGLERWHLRGPIFILGSVAVFALTIRTLGLAFAGPLAMLVSCFAADDVRWKEAIIFAVAMTAFCIILFKVLLGLPIPVIAFL
ncbi:MAG: tripartite tricarboxylate transporter TctB family protein [Alsobacter sp.]